MESLLSIRDLSLEFAGPAGEQKVLQGVSLDIPRGSTVGLVGESGSGKSITALTIMGLLHNSAARITSGEIFFEGRDLLSLPQRDLQAIRGGQIAMVFQEPMSSLNPVFTVGNQISQVLRRHLGLGRVAARERATELLDTVGIKQARRQLAAYPHELSGGQKQRVMIAMAVACEPNLMIADEPTTALDVTTQRQVLALLESLRESQSMSMLFITHDLALVGELAEQLVVLHQGQVRECGPLKQIFEDPQHPYTRGLLACRPRLSGNPRRLPTVGDFISSDGKPLPVSPCAPWQRPTRSAQPLLQVKDLSVRFPGQRGLFGQRRSAKQAVDRVSLEVPRGQTLGLVGESGCGKTSLGRAIVRLIEPSAGQIRFDQQSVSDLSAKELRALRARMQIIFQDPYSSLNPRMTIAQALIEPMTLHGLGRNRIQRRDRAARILQQVGLGASALNHFPHQFSGGQRQRICIARALTVKPELIICDECVSSLDVSVQAQILNLLADLQEQHGLTYLFISHDLSVIRFVADQVAVMHRGRIIERGTPEQIYRQPQEPYTQALLDAVPNEPPA
jgi:peptide/nickel transport system ATP-binding protein